MSQDVEHGTKLDLDHLRSWIGNSESSFDLVSARAVRAMRAVLSLPEKACRPGEAAPLAMHWCYLLDLMSGPGSDPRTGADRPFVPPVPLAQRMWAGGSTEFIAPLRVGDQVTRQSEVASVEVKNGRSGPLCFVTVEHTYSTPTGVATKDTQNLVFLDPAPKVGARVPAEPVALRSAQHVRTMCLEAPDLFRYSVLTHNGHPSHYDRGEAMGAEALPGLMVHGPLLASLLLEFAVELQGAVAVPKNFKHRGVASMFEGELTLNANRIADGFDLWVADAQGAPTMTAEVTW